MEKIKWLVFDLGGVVVRVNAGWVYDSMQRAGWGEPAALLDFFKQEQIWDRIQIGGYHSADIRAALSHGLKLDCSEQAIVDCMNAEIGDEIVETLELIKKLKGKINIACLSNTNPIHWEHLYKHVRAMKYFEPAMASHLFGCAKPHREIFELAAKELKSSPASCLLIDDREENIDGATAAGWQAVLYTGHEKLLEDLRRFGLGPLIKE